MKPSPVVGYTTVALADGVQGTYQTVSIMRDIANHSIMDPSVRWQAERILEAARTKAADQAAEARAILDWIATKTIYQQDPQRGMDEQEVVQMPAWVIQQVASGTRPRVDCDDLTVLELALAGSIGIPGLIRVVSRRPDKVYNHVYPANLISGQWMEVDPTRWMAARATGQWPAAKTITAHFDTLL